MQRQIQLDNEALQRLFMSQMAQQAATSPPANQNQGQSVKMSSGALSPLGQAMLQIHSPAMSASETEETAADKGENGANEILREVNNVSHMTVSSASKENDDVFAEKNSDSVNSDLTHTTLQNAVPNIPAAHVGPVYIDRGISKSVSDVMNVNALNAKLMAEINGGGPVDINKIKDSIINGGQKTSKGNSPTRVKSPGNAASEIIIPRPQSNAAMSAGSPRSSSSGSQERRRIKKEPRDAPKPHPAFNVPPSQLDKLNGFYYNYNLPDRGLGTSLSPAPVSISPPAARHQKSPPGTHRSPPVSHPRLPSLSPGLASQAGLGLGMMGPGWPVRGASPSGDSRSSGSPLDLSGPKDALVKIKPDIIPREVPIKPKQAKPNQISVQPVHSPSQIPRMTLTVPNTHIPPVHNTPVQMPKIQPQVITTPVQVPSFQRAEISRKIVQEPPKNIAEKKQVSAPSVKQASPPTQNKTPYIKETLYLFGDKDLEIISVGRNKWIIRNETELCKLVKEHVGGDNKSEAENENTRKTENCSNCHQKEEEKDNNFEAMKESWTAEAVKRQNDTEDNSPQRTKVTKLTNGDIHSEENSPQAEQITVTQTEYSDVSGVSSASVNVPPPSSVEIAHSVAAIMIDTQSSSSDGNTCPVLATMLNVKPL